MKKLKILSVMIVLLLVLVACGDAGNSPEADDNSNNNENNQGANEEKITLKLAIGAPATAPLSKFGIEPFMERVTELTDGQVEFDYYPGEQLGRSADLLNLTRAGVADIGYYAFNPNMPITNAIGQLPGLAQSTEQGNQAYNDVIREEPFLTTDFLNNGVVPVFGFLTPPFEFFTKGEEIKRPEDLEGLRVNSAGGILDEVLEDLGAVPTTLQAADLYEGFERGVIDVLLQAPSTADSYGLGELMGYGTSNTSFASAAVGIAMNQGVWEGLPDDVKEAFDQASKEVAQSLGQELDADNQSVLDEWSQSFSIYELTNEEFEAWDEVGKTAQQNFVDENEEMYKEALNLYNEKLENYE